MSTNVNDWIKGGSKIPAAKFDSVGASALGVVCEIDVSQCRSFDKNEPEWWDEAKTQPKEQLVITLQTDDRSLGADDDGKRRIYAKKPGNMLTAIADALAEAGSEIQIGGRLALVMTGSKPHEKPGFNPIKEYKAAYEPAAQGAANDLLTGAGNAQPDAGQPAAADPAALLG